MAFSFILFNLLNNDVLDKCDEFGINIGKNKKCRRGLFVDNFVLIAPSAFKWF